MKKSDYYDREKYKLRLWYEQGDGKYLRRSTGEVKTKAVIDALPGVNTIIRQFRFKP